MIGGIVMSSDANVGSAVSREKFFDFASVGVHAPFDALLSDEPSNIGGLPRPGGGRFPEDVAVGGPQCAAGQLDLLMGGDLRVMIPSHPGNLGIQPGEELSQLQQQPDAVRMPCLQRVSVDYQMLHALHERQKRIGVLQATPPVAKVQVGKDAYNRVRHGAKEMILRAVANFNS